jgi:hypothetical protein
VCHRRETDRHRDIGKTEKETFKDRPPNVQSGDSEENGYEK